MSAWLFDLGNTRLKCAPLVAGRVGEVVALPHRESDIAEALATTLPSRIDSAYVASVAGDGLRVALLEALAARTPRISLARTQARFGEFQIAYAQPHKLGVDRFLAMLAAHARGPGPTLVCGIGTALTLDLVDGRGLHVGGRIAPSPTLMREVLHERASHLPVRGGEYADFATDTEPALASGCEGAALALIEASRQAAMRRLGEAPRLLLHGGGAREIASQLPEWELADGLVLEGLALWAAADSTAAQASP